MTSRSFLVGSFATLSLLLASCSGGDAGNSSTDTITSEEFQVVDLKSGAYSLELDTADVVCEGLPTQRGRISMENVALSREGDAIIVTSNGTTVAMGEVNDDKSFRLSFQQEILGANGNALLQGFATDQGLTGAARVTFTTEEGTKCYQLTSFSGAEVTE